MPTDWMCGKHINLTYIALDWLCMCPQSVCTAAAADKADSPTFDAFGFCWMVLTSPESSSGFHSPIEQLHHTFLRNPTLTLLRSVAILLSSCLARRILFFVLIFICEFIIPNEHFSDSIYNYVLIHSHSATTKFHSIKICVNHFCIFLQLKNGVRMTVEIVRSWTSDGP